MGSGASSVYESPGSELRLPTTGLRFSTTQLRSLNSYVDNLYQQDQIGRMTTDMESTVESLVQRIVDGAGQRDPRFRCCHLIALHREKKMRSRSLEYLVTLDSFPSLTGSSECFLQEGPVGYVKIRLTGKLAEKWEEFLTPGGYLSRDKIIERWVELIARCAHAKGGGGPRVLCVRAAQRAVPYQYCYLERVSSPPTSSEPRLAIVEGAVWVMVRVGNSEAKLVLGAGFHGCSSHAYSCHVPLIHPMALLHYTAAQNNLYAVAVGPPSSIVCAERQATWQVWSPGLEAELDGHLAMQGAAGRVAGAVNALLDRMRDGVAQGSLRIISRYMIWCALRRRLDKCGYHQQAAARACISLHASHHFLLVLDELISTCFRRTPSGYVFELPRSAVTRRGVRASEADWTSDGECLKHFLQHLHADSSRADIQPMSVSESLEMALLHRWENLVKESKTTTTAPSYSRRQLKYLWRLATELLKCKSRIIYDNHSTFRANLINATALEPEPLEDLIHILAIMLDQARDLYLQQNFPQPRNVGEYDIATYRSKKWYKLKDYYDASSACLIDAVRRDTDLRKENLNENLNVMKQVLNWLYKGAKDDKKYLGPVLKSYLDSLYLSSLENSWFLEDFDSKKCVKEYEGLREYCAGVHDGHVEPCLGLLGAAKKLSWAKVMVDFIDRFKHVDLRIVFPTGDGMGISYLVKLSPGREHSSRALTLTRRDKAEAKLRLARRCVLTAFYAALIGEERSRNHVITRHGSTDEILANIKTGNYWRNSTKPDIIPAQLELDQPKMVRRRLKRRPMTTYGFPEISLSNQDPIVMKQKYYTLKSLVYTEPMESVKEMKRRPRSAGSTVRSKETMSRPSLLETLDFINGVKNAVSVEDSAPSDAEESPWGAADDWLLSRCQPLPALARPADHLHLTLGDVTVALLQRGKFTILQELCPWLGEANEGALLALHRLARAARSRSSERHTDSWKLPEAQGVVTEPEQKYRPRPPDYVSGDEAPQPPPLPRSASKKQIITQKSSDYIPPKRLQELENHIRNLEIMQAKLNLTSNLKNHQSTNVLAENYTGIINPLFEEKKILQDKFTTKRSKSLGRSFSSRKIGIDISRYNLSLGRKSGQRTNDVITAIFNTTGETGIDVRKTFLKYSDDRNVVGDSYRLSRYNND